MHFTLQCKNGEDTAISSQSVPNFFGTRLTVPWFLFRAGFLPTPLNPLNPLESPASSPPSAPSTLRCFLIRSWLPLSALSFSKGGIPKEAPIFIYLFICLGKGSNKHVHCVLSTGWKYLASPTGTETLIHVYCDIIISFSFLFFCIFTTTRYSISGMHNIG